jgi:hypothetical protein
MEELELPRRLKSGFHTIATDKARALSRCGTRTITELADDYAHTYAPFIRAAVREVGQNYRQVVNWLTRERIPAQRSGRWAAQSMKNLVERYEKLTGKRLLPPTKPSLPQPSARMPRPRFR